MSKKIPDVVWRPTENEAFFWLFSQHVADRVDLTPFEWACLRAERRYLRRTRGASSEDVTYARLLAVAMDVRAQRWQHVAAALARADRVAWRREFLGLPGFFDG